MKILKTSLTSYILALSMILTSVLPAFAQATPDVEGEQSSQSSVDLSADYDVNNPDSILFGTVENDKTDEEAKSISEDIMESVNENQSIQLFSNDEDEELGGYTDTSHMSDEDFFGVWDNDSKVWKKEGKLKYDYSPDLETVETLVKSNSYSLAKDALLDYYRNRKTIERAEFAGSINWDMNKYWMKDTYAYSETPITSINITNNTDEYQLYSIDVSKNKSTSVYHFSSITKTEDMICIGSRESEYSPSLVITKKDDSIITLKPTKDTYIRGLDDKADYSKNIYGDSTELYVKDAAYQNEDGVYKPYSSKSRRAYIAFNADDYPNEIKSIRLQIYAKIVPEEGKPVATENNHELHVWNAYNKSWDEVKKKDNDFLPMTWADYKLAHYSWDGIPGGYDWDYPDNVGREFINSNTRFNNFESLVLGGIQQNNQDYIKKAIEVMLDFISDTNGIIETGFPVDRDIEAANRTRLFPAIFAAFLDTDYFNGEALTAILKWLWEDMTYLYNGAGILYQGATDKAQSNNYAESNRGLWNVAGMEGICTYFPEYTDRDNWKAVADKRMYTVSHVLLNDDGCYQEPTYSYALNMLNYYINLHRCLIHDPGSEVPDWFLGRVGEFARYIMYCSGPNHQPPKFGDGAAGNTSSALKRYTTLVKDDEMLYVATDGKEGVEPEVKTKYYHQLRIVTSRTDWTQKANMLFMSAKNGGSHAHRDSLHMVFFTGSRDLLADTGNTSYDPEHPHFDWQRTTTRSHNTIEIDGTAQRGSSYLYNNSPTAKNGDAKLDLYTCDTADRIVAWTDANFGFRHYRNVSYIKNHNFLIVSDKVSPTDTNEHTYTQNWHTSATDPSDPTIDNVTKIARTNYDAGYNLLIAQANPENLNLSLETGYSVNSPDPTKYFCYTQKGVGDIMYNTVLYPSESGSTSNITIENIETGVDPAVASAMNINLFKNDNDVLNVFYYNSFEENPSKRTFNGYITDSSNVTIEQDVVGIPQFISMYNGTIVEKEGNTILSSDKVLENVEILYDGTTAVITSQDEDITSAKLVALTPGKIDNVTINGESVNFVYSDNKIYLNNNEAVDFSLDKGYVAKITAEDNKGNTYPVIVEIPAGSVESGTLQMPECTFNNGTFTLTFGNATLTSSAKVTFSEHTDQTVIASVGGRDKQVSIEMTVGSTQEQADKTVKIGSPYLENAREDLIIWTKDATIFKITALKPSSGGGGGGGGGAPQPKPLPTDEENKEEEEDGEGAINPLPPEDSKSVFADCKTHWAKDDINYMYENGYVNGINETTFAPDANVTRAEFAAIAARILKLEQLDYSSVFKDVKSDDWYAPVVETAYEAGIIQGSNGSFRPNDKITREEMAVILMRVYNIVNEYNSESELTFADSGKISDWAKEAVASACELELINGMGGNNFAPKSNTTRAQSATVFRRLLEKQKQVKEE